MQTHDFEEYVLADLKTNLEKGALTLKRSRHIARAALLLSKKHGKNITSEDMHLFISEFPECGSLLHGLARQDASLQQDVLKDLRNTLKNKITTII